MTVTTPGGEGPSTPEELAAAGLRVVVTLQVSLYDVHETHRTEETALWVLSHPIPPGLADAVVSATLRDYWTPCAEEPLAVTRAQPLTKWS